MSHERLAALVRRYTPTMLDVIAPADPADINRWRHFCGGRLAPDYEAFLTWMGAACPFLDGEDLAYAPDDLLDLVEAAPDAPVPNGYDLIGIDKSGNALDLHLQQLDGVVVRIGPGCQPGDKGGFIPENRTFESYLLTAYIRRTLVPSHPYHFFAAVMGDEARLATFLQLVGEACSRFTAQLTANLGDVRLFGADVVVATHRRPASRVIHLAVGAVDRGDYERWYDLAFERWHCSAMAG